MKPREWEFTLAVDPATIEARPMELTIVVNPERKGTRCRHVAVKRGRADVSSMALLAKSATHRTGAWLPPAGRCVRLGLTFLFAVPKTTLERPDRARDIPEEGEPCFATWAGDLVKKTGAVVEALTQARFWPTDRYVTRIDARKLWTRGSARIEVRVEEHSGRDFD